MKNYKDYIERNLGYLKNDHKSKIVIENLEAEKKMKCLPFSGQLVAITKYAPFLRAGQANPMEPKLL